MVLGDTSDEDEFLHVVFVRHVTGEEDDGNKV